MNSYYHRLKYPSSVWKVIFFDVTIMQKRLKFLQEEKEGKGKVEGQRESCGEKKQ